MYMVGGGKGLCCNSLGKSSYQGFHPFLLGWWNFPEKAMLMSWLEGIILASSILRVERREKAEISQILGHNSYLIPLLSVGDSCLFQIVPCVPESRDPLL